MRWALFTLALVGCSGQELQGSLGTVYDLGFDRVRARLYSSSLSIEFVRSDGAVPVRVSVDRAPLEEGVRDVDLAAQGDVTGRTGEGREIPRFDSGEVSFSSLRLEEGRTVEGKWSAEFPVSDADRLGLSGRFAASLEVVPDPGPPPPGRTE